MLLKTGINYIFASVAAFLLSCALFAQQQFPSQQLDSIMQRVAGKIHQTTVTDPFSNFNSSSTVPGVGRHLAGSAVLSNNASSSAPGFFYGDTLYIATGDSLYISGNYNYTGTIAVVNGGVLFMENCTATIEGDIILYGQNSRATIKNSTVNFPQAFIYQRKIMLTGTSSLIVDTCTFNYSGLSHDLIITNNASVVWNQLQNIGFTTCGVSENASITIDGTNQAGEFILTNQATAHFKNAKTILIWHHIPSGGSMDVAFPTGDTIGSFDFSSMQSSVANIGYTYSLDQCSEVLWGLMPEPGSNLKVSNSNIRAIGVWLKNQQGFQVSGLINESQYSNFVAPLSGHHIELVNTYVRTWSLYAFDQAQGNVENCILGEIGTFSNSNVTMDNSIVDGSGGYTFSHDQSVLLTQFSYYNGDFQTKAQSFGFMLYGGQNFGRTIANGNSIMIVVQSNTPALPEINDNAMVWYTKLEGPATLYTNSQNQIIGSAWIEKASAFYPNELFYYTLSYRQTEVDPWVPITGPVYQSAFSQELGIWNTSGLPSGSYTIKLTMVDNTLDSNSVEALRVYNLQSANGIDVNDRMERNQQVFPNPANEILYLETGIMAMTSYSIYDVRGREVLSGLLHPSVKNGLEIFIGTLEIGSYSLATTYTDGSVAIAKFVVSR